MRVIPHWQRRWTATKPKEARPQVRSRPARRRPSLEQLEDRAVLSNSSTVGLMASLALSHSLDARMHSNPTQGTSSATASAQDTSTQDGSTRDGSTRDPSQHGHCTQDTSTESSSTQGASTQDSTQASS